jgi:(R)-amidase
MQVELAQMPCDDGDVAANLARVLAAIAACAPQTALIVFPETCLMGFPDAHNIAAVAQALDGPALSAVQQAARERGVAVAIGLAEAAPDGRFFNTTVLLTPEGIALTYRKTHLWATDRGVFAPGSELVCTEWNGLRVGLLICYDIEFPEPARALAGMGVDLLLVTNGNMDPYGPVHRRAIAARAQENQLFAVMVNRCGTGGGLDFAGESAVLDPFGEVVHACGRGAEQVVVTLDLARLRACRADYDHRVDRRIALRGREEARPSGQRAFVIAD